MLQTNTEAIIKDVGHSTTADAKKLIRNCKTIKDVHRAIAWVIPFDTEKDQVSALRYLNKYGIDAIVALVNSHAKEMLKASGDTDEEADVDSEYRTAADLANLDYQVQLYSTVWAYMHWAGLTGENTQTSKLRAILAAQDKKLIARAKKEYAN